MPEAKESWLFPPRQVILISTTDMKGNYNVAPHAEFIKLYDDLHFIIAIEDFHDTYANILETGEFVIGLPPINIAKAISITGKPFQKGVSEFEKANLTPLKADKVNAPLIKECIINYECKFEKELGKIGTEAIIVGKVIETHADKTLLTNEMETRLNTKAALHVSKGRIFTTINKETIDTEIDYKKE